jgi:hypothetical protein|tara:strand:- start:6241 stop:6510 length:270 start_codon:yes stop_codon:yes gene_type:complete
MGATQESNVDEESLVDRDVNITLRNGGTIGPFNATWNYGLREFLEEYEKFLKTGEQKVFRFGLQPDARKPTATLILKFDEVLAISSVTN